MADFKLYFPIENEEEGVTFENVPGDSGGATKFGLIVDDLKKCGIDENHDGVINWEDVKLLTPIDAANILKKVYWDRFDADNISNQSLAEFIVDGGLNQGIPTITKMVQEILNLQIDGVPGPHTNAAIAVANPKSLFDSLYIKRKQRYNDIVINNPSQNKFLKGWYSRLNNIKYTS